MIILKKLFFLNFIFCAVQALDAVSLAERFEQFGYVEMLNNQHTATTFDALYAYFDEFIEFLQTNPAWAHKLYRAKERFIRSKNKNYYSTEVFGFYDESQRVGRSQISFYYSTHLHEYICSCYPECNQVPQIIRFLQACYELEKPYTDVFNQAAAELGVGDIFSSSYGRPPVLLKVVKYLPDYIASKPHYDGTAFSLFLDSTDNQSLLLSLYKSSFSVDDFSAPARMFSRWHHQNSMLLIPGLFLTEFSIYPTPHIVVESGNTRYATIAFAMRPDYIHQKTKLAELPTFKH